MAEPAFRPVRGGNAFEETVERLLQSIKLGQVRDGERLPAEREPAAQLRVQFARQGVRVNALCPGPVDTPLLRELFATDPERAARWLVHVPMGRFADPTEIAAAIAFLASDDSSFITASAFLVDGGITAAYVTPL